MALEHRLELKMLQKLILTPQLQQAIKLLQMPQLELSQMLTNELAENPLLEEVGEETAADAVEERESGDSQDDVEVPLERLLGFSVDEYFDTRSHDGRDLGYFSPDSSPVQSLDQYVSEGPHLSDHLDWQLRMADVPLEVETAAEVVLGNLDDNGYLRATSEDIAAQAGVDAETALRAVALVQTFDPTGVGARDLKECLLLQLVPLGLQGTLVENLVRNNLKDIEGRKYQKLASQYQCSLEDVKQALSIISNLEPKPCRGLSGTEPVYVKPDVYIVRDEAGFRIILSDEHMPNIRINGYYRRLLSQKNTLQKDEKDYLAERLRSAVWLLKSLDHRNKTIYRVTESILNFQRDFFEHGVSYMKPLNLRDVAQDLEMHESTISRATSNKYVSCPHGMFNFRYFFSSSVQSDNGAVSSTRV
jgi:RNA polymerase sigma-54 factor